jgi:hypothetical protein
VKPAPTLLRELLSARQAGLKLRPAAAVAGGRKPPEPRPRVRWRRDCPLCKARVVVRSAGGKTSFWRCKCWLCAAETATGRRNWLVSRDLSSISVLRNAYFC